MDNLVSEPSSPYSMCLVSVVKYPTHTEHAPDMDLGSDK